MSKKPVIYTKTLRQALLLAQLVLLCVPEFRAFILTTETGYIPASWCYFFSLVFAPYLLLHIRQLRLPPWWLSVLAVYVVVLALVRIPEYGLARNILHWVFGAYLITVILNVGADFSKEDWLRLLETAACLFACIHFLYLVYHRDIVLRLLRGYYTGELSGMEALWLPYLTRGGRNLDCSWLALGGFFVRGRKKAVYVTYVVLFAFLGSSRAGVLSVGLLILWSLVWDPLYRLTRRSFKWYLLYAAAMLALLFATGMAQAFLGRNLIGSGAAQTQILDMYGSPAAAMLSGRAEIWERVPRMFADNSWGYGVGNALRVMKQSYGLTRYEDIVHNVFMQWLLDEGWIGGLWFIGLAAAFLYRQWRRRPRFFEDPLDGYFAVYFALSMVQFHGAEALMIYVLGIYLLQTGARLLPLLPARKGAAP